MIPAPAAAGKNIKNAVEVSILVALNRRICCWLIFAIVEISTREKAYK